MFGLVRARIKLCPGRTWPSKVCIAALARNDYSFSCVIGNHAFGALDLIRIVGCITLGTLLLGTLRNTIELPCHGLTSGLSSHEGCAGSSRMRQVYI